MDLLLADSFLVYKKGYIADLVFGQLKKQQEKKRQIRFGFQGKVYVGWSPSNSRLLDFLWTGPP